MRVLYVAADNAAEKNCSIWLCENPARAIASLPGHEATVIKLEDFIARRADAECRQADLIVVERNLFGQALQAIGFWQANGKAVIAAFDDALDLIPPSNPAHAFWRLGLIRTPEGKLLPRDGPMPLVEFETGLRMVRAATVPSRKLALDWRKFTPTHYLPNFIDTAPYLAAAKQRQPHDGIVIGWGGSAGHLQSFTGSGLLSALLSVCQLRPQVKVVICSGDPRVFNHLPVKNKELRPWVPYAQWPSQMADFDIGLAPLAGPFDERRSWIKPLEYSLMDIPWLASFSPAYQDLIPMNSFTSNTAIDWIEALLERIDHLDDYRARVAAARSFALKQDLFANAQRIVDLYEEILK